MHTLLNDDFFLKKGYTISTDQERIDVEMVFKFLSEESYWSKGIALPKLKKAIANSICFGVYLKDRQIGFARVVSDKATFAYICDVFILHDHRALGLSKWLIQTILAHPELQELRRWSLATADAHGLYSQFGFTRIVRPERWMEIFTPYSQ
jgi:GNAT superfamily N-acetyltransferase